MAKFEKISEETQKQFDNVLKNRTSITDMVEFELICDNSMKQLYKTIRASDLYKWKTGKEVIIIINEIVLEQLDETSQLLSLEEALMYVTFDSEKDKVVIEKPDLVTFSPIIKKYPEEYIRTFECIKAIFAQQKEKEAEEKANKIANKKKF
jgi:hypothetical protein